MKTKFAWAGLPDILADFDRLSKETQDSAIRSALRAAASPLSRAVKSASPSKRVKRAIAVAVSGAGVAVKARVGAKSGTPGVRLLHLLEKGTGPHTIRAKRGKQLVIPGGKMGTVRVEGKRRRQWAAGPVMGARFMGPEVHHPGMRGRHFFVPVLVQEEAEVRRKFGSAFKSIVKKMALRSLKSQGI